MDTIQYGQGALPFDIPPDAIITEITPYLWPGHYGEWDEAAQEFTAWALVSPSSWRVTSEILAPPVTCLSVGATVKRLRWRVRLGLSSETGSQDVSQEFHVEFRQPLKLSDPSLIDQLDMAPPVSPHQKTHPALNQTIDPSSESQKTNPVLELAVVAVAVQAKGQEAVWRIHTRIHARIHKT